MSERENKLLTRLLRLGRMGRRESMRVLLETDGGYLPFAGQRAQLGARRERSSG